jgi:hypothetical protein
MLVFVMGVNLKAVVVFEINTTFFRASNTSSGTPIREAESSLKFSFSAGTKAGEESLARTGGLTGCCCEGELGTIELDKTEESDADELCSNPEDSFMPLSLLTQLISVSMRPKLHILVFMLPPLTYLSYK